MNHSSPLPNISAILMLILVGAGCDAGPAGPADRVLVVPTPTFLVIPDPGSPPPERACGQDEGYQFSSHFSSSYNNRAEFRTPYPVSLRSQCGDLPFDESGVGTVDLYYRYLSDTLADYEMWARRQRIWDAPLDFDDDSMYLGLIAGDTLHHVFGAPAQDGYDLTAFANRHAQFLYELGTDFSSPFTQNSDALAQLWRSINPPYGFAVGFYSDSQPWLTWTNQHRGRTADSTQVYRRVNGGQWQYRTTVAHDVESFVDGPLSPAAYGYFIRHVTAVASTVNDNSPIAQPASWSTEARSVATGAPPPTGLACEGNFDATMDCSWYNAVANAPSEILRGGVPRDTLSGGSVNTLVEWTDAVTRGQTYAYQVRHLVSGAPGRLSTPPHSAVANPVAPVSLLCSGATDTTITCQWADTEPDTILVYRRVGQGDSTVIALVNPGQGVYTNTGLNKNLTYCYRVRYRRGSADFSAFSGEACAQPGDQGPLHPEP